MLVVMTALMCWLGYHIDHISRRYRLAKASHEIGVRFSIRHPYSDPRISWTRRLLGDKDVNVIGVPTKLDLAKSKELKRAFPEATVQPVEVYAYMFRDFDDLWP